MCPLGGWVEDIENMEMYKRKMAITYFFTTISNFLEFFSSIHFPHPQTQFVFTVYNLVSCFFSLYITSYSFYPLFELFLNIVSDCIIFYHMAFPKFTSHSPCVASFQCHKQGCGYYTFCVKNAIVLCHILGLNSRSRTT